MLLLGLSFLVALVVSSVGFKKYIWFISIGYGFSIAGIGLLGLVWGGGALRVPVTLMLALLIAYGVRLGGYLAYRELTSATYNANMKGEVKSGKGMPLAALFGIWVAASLLYAAETSPVTFRVTDGGASDALLVVGLIVSALGFVFETVADAQKSASKKVRPKRFCDTGLYRLVRCPNYFGELLLWTGVFVGGIPVYTGALRWVVALLGYLGIVYVMFSGARRLELRQNRRYGKDPEYRAYVARTPIIIPFVPLKSVARYRWLVG